MKRPRDLHEPVERVRWKQGRSWRYGHLNGQRTETDGSLRVYDDYTGGTRSLPATAVQQEDQGPRGGRCWTWVEPPPAPNPEAEPGWGRPAWRPPEGPAELLNQHTLWEQWP